MIIPTTVEEALGFTYFDAMKALGTEEMVSNACATLVDNGDALRLLFPSDHVVTYFEDGSITLGLHGHGELQIRPATSWSDQQGGSTC
jgi:hypothetical protein